MSEIPAIGPSTLVRDILLDLPGARHAFDAHHVDYCCGGALSLEEACTRARVGVDVVLATLASEANRPGAEPSRDRELMSLPLTEIVGRIIGEHHERARRDMGPLLEQARETARADGETHPGLHAIRKNLEILAGDLLPHLGFEERYVFPYIVALERADQEGLEPPVALFASITEPIADMIREHEAADHAVHAIRVLMNVHPAGSGSSQGVRALYEALAEHEREIVSHMHVEGNILFPRAAQLERKLRAIAADEKGGRRRS